MNRTLPHAPADRYSLGAYLTLGQNLIAYSLAVIVAMLVCWILNMATASRLAGITATIILLVPHVGAPERMFLSRVAEVGWCVCAAVGTVWLVERILRFPWSSGRSEQDRPLAAVDCFTRTGPLGVLARTFLSQLL